MCCCVPVEEGCSSEKTHLGLPRKSGSFAPHGKKEQAERSVHLDFPGISRWGVSREDSYMEVHGLKGVDAIRRWTNSI